MIVDTEHYQRAWNLSRDQRGRAKTLRNLCNDIWAIRGTACCSDWREFLDAAKASSLLDGVMAVAADGDEHLVGEFLEHERSCPRKKPFTETRIGKVMVAECNGVITTRTL